MIVGKVIPVGVVDGVAGPELLVDGELWFVLSVSHDDWRFSQFWLLFDGVSVVRCCWWQWVNAYIVSDIRECSVEELKVMRAAVVEYLVSVGVG